MATRKGSKTRTPVRRKARLAPRRDKRGLAASEIVLARDAPPLAALSAEVEAVGGAVIGAYREPLSGRALLLAALPVEAVQPTPFQRDLSPTHAKRLAEKIEESGAFLDPLIVVRGDVQGRTSPGPCGSASGTAGDRATPGAVAGSASGPRGQSAPFWTPNGRHRLAAARHLGLKQITALVSADDTLAFRILALNTEKAHNLKDRSLEVIRMARNLATRQPRARENEFTAEFEAPELLTLGIVYARNPRFGGGAYSPFLKKVDRFSDKTLAASLRAREDHAARLAEIDAEVRRIVQGLEARGFKSPYLRSYVVARINPVRFHQASKGDRRPAMPIGAALTRMAAAARKFDLATVKTADLALVAAVAGEAG